MLIPYWNQRKNFCSWECRWNSKARFLRKVNKNGPTQSHAKHLGNCWQWLGSGYNFPSLPYGRFKFKGKKYPSHRFSWITFKGIIPDGIFVLHKCDNPKCVNPKHLKLGTHQDNSDDKIRKGRDNPPVGERAHSCKLNPLKVIEIRKKYSSGDFTCQKLGKMFNVSRSAIQGIISGKTWRHV